MKKICQATTKKGGDIFKIISNGLYGSSRERLLDELGFSLASNKAKSMIFTCNPEFLVYAQANLWFKKILNKANYLIADGIGLVWASRFLYGRKLNRIHGTDLMEELCRLAAKQGGTVYFLGGQPGVATKALENLKKRYSGLKGWAEAGPQLEIRNWKLEITEKWVKEINKKKPTFLFVGLGMGKQEKFIYDNWGKLEVKLAMGVGGAFDYLSGAVPRAPSFLRNLVLEWLYRLVRQPWRLRRQLALIKFIWLVLKEKLAV